MMSEAHSTGHSDPNGNVDVGVALTVAALPLWFQLSLMSECLERVERALAGPPENRAAEADFVSMRRSAGR